MIKQYLSILSFCMLTSFCIAQNDNSVVTDSLSSFLVKGCEKHYTRDLCSKQRLSDIVYDAINNDQDIQNLHANREKISNPFINIKIRLYFDVRKNLIKEKSFIKVLDKNGEEFLDFTLSFSVRDLPLLEPSPILAEEETYLESLLQLILDQKTLELRQMPIFNEKLQNKFLEEREEGGKQYAIYKGCENNRTYESQRKCFEEKISQFVNQRFNREVAIGTDLKGKVRIFTRFVIAKDGSITDVGCRAPHSKLKDEMLRICKLLPKIKPGTVNGQSVDITYLFPIIFTIQ